MYSFKLVLDSVKMWVCEKNIQKFLVIIGNGYYSQFRQSFAKETFSYDEYSKS